MSAPICAAISSASRPSGSPDRFAEVVGSGPMAAASARWGVARSGTRRPIVGEPPVRAAGIATSGRCGTMTVSPPGQKAAPRAAAAGVMTPIVGAWAASARSNMIPLSGGRCFTWNRRSTPPAVSSDTAIPYTVSVGSATTPPLRRHSAASEIPASSAATIRAVMRSRDPRGPRGHGLSGQPLRCCLCIARTREHQRLDHRRDTLVRDRRSLVPGDGLHARRS